jgi:hypothetical protein
LREGNSYLLEKITIPAEAIQQIRLDLDISGISEATIFPDLEALSRELDALWRFHFSSATSPSKVTI